jgi:hypothetical protein
VVGNAVLNTFYYYGSIPTTSTLNVYLDRIWEGKVTGTIYASDGTTPITDFVFYNNSENHTTLTGPTSFYDNATNFGTIIGNPTFSGTSHNTTNGVITGNPTFSGSSYNGGTITGDASFASAAYNSGTITGNPTFNNTQTFQIGSVNGTTTLSGTNQTIQGSNSTTNLVKTSAIRDTLYLGSGSSLSVSGVLTLTGADETHLLTVRTTIPGSSAALNINGPATMNYLRLRDIHNGGSNVVNVSTSVVYNDGGNIGFTFGSNSGFGQIINPSNVNDTTPPSGTLIGSSPMTVYRGSTWSDPGVAWSDAGGVNRTSVIGSVNTSVIGTYTIIYRATDNSNNTGQVSRTVNVIAALPTPDPVPPANNNKTGNIYGVSLDPAVLGNLKLKPLPIFITPVAFGTGTTKLFNPLEGLLAPGSLRLGSTTLFSFDDVVTGFLFSPLPKEITALAKALPTVDKQLKDRTISREKDILKLIGNPLILPKLSDIPSSIKIPDSIHFVTVDGKQVATNLSVDKKGKLIQTITVPVNANLGVFINVPKVKSKVLFNNQRLTYLPLNNGSVATFTAPEKEGVYSLIASNTFKLEITVVSPVVSPKSPPPKKSVWSWFSKIF